MRLPIASLLVVASLAAPSAAAQSGGPAPAGTPAIRACALLTRDVATKFSATANPRLLDLLPPEEDRIGVNGSGCEYGGIYLQIDPFARPEQLRKSPPKDWQAVAGVGDTAYLRNNKNGYAELMVFSGAHHFTIQMSVPTGGSADTVKSNTIGLANALIPKLR